MSARSSWLRSFLSDYKRPVVVALALGLVASGFSALLMFASGYLISATAQEGMTLFAIMLPVAFVQVFGLGRPLARYLERLVSHDWVLRVTSDMRRVLFRHVAAWASDPTEGRPSGEYLALLSDDIAHLQNLYLRVVFPSVIAVLLCLGAAIAFGAFSLPFACAMLVVLMGTVVGLPYATWILTRATEARAKELRAECYESLTDDVLGLQDWMLSGRWRDAVERHRGSFAETRALGARVRMAERAMELVSSLVLGACVCAVLAWSAGAFGGDPSTANWIAAFALGFFPLIESFAVLPGVTPDATGHMRSVDRLQEIYRQADGAAEGETPGAAFGEGALGIEARQVVYAYPGAARPALDCVSFSVPAGQHVAVLGRSGSGKSTLASVLRGLLDPQEGSASVGGVRVVAHETGLSSAMGYLSQEPYLFNKTLRENLTMAARSASDEQLVGLMEAVGLGDRLRALPDGLGTVVGETGVGFSGGEAHRIALARVLAADVGVLIVDEPFAALDPATERDLMDTLLRLCADKTLVVITHHLALVERFDRVVFMAEGRIALDGAPERLMESSEYFRSLVAADGSWRDAGSARPM